MDEAKRDQFLKDIVTTAVEGAAIQYWCNVNRYDPDLCVAWIKEDDDTGDQDTHWHKLNANMIAKGISRIKREDIKMRRDILSAILVADKTNDAGEIDIEAADVIIQAAMFGEIVYG